MPSDLLAAALAGQAVGAQEGIPVRAGRGSFCLPSSRGGGGRRGECEREGQNGQSAILKQAHTRPRRIMADIAAHSDRPLSSSVALEARFHRL